MKQFHVTKLRARYEETDQMGVIHHSKYVNWFEVGRTECLREAGMDYRAVEEKGFMLPVLEVNLKYLKPATYDDEIEVRTRILSYSGIRLNFHYVVYRDQEILVEGSTHHCFTDRNLKPIYLKKQWPEAHQFITATLAQQDGQISQDKEKSHV